MSSDEIPHVLDNTSWHALNSYQSKFAISNGLAKRYLSDVASLTAIADSTEAAFNDLAGIVSKGETIGVDFWELTPQVPAGWTIIHSLVLIQMVSEGIVSEMESSESVVNLTVADVPDMLRLVDLTEPGPFYARTIELGHYIGIRHQGELIAMAGERRHLPGYREISAVCTHPDHVGKGYAHLLMGQLNNEICRRGEVPFLLVRPQNERAFRLYQHLHFRARGEVHVLVLSR